MLWVYLGWVIVLLGAVIAAYAPSLQMRVVRQPDHAGQRFTLALALLGELARARRSGARGVALLHLAERLRVDPLQIEPALAQLHQLDWVGTLEEDGEQRQVLLCEPAQTPAAPLIDGLLLQPSAASAAFRAHTRLATLNLADLLEA